MAKIYISYNTNDRDIANAISEGLRELGHEIALDVDMLMAGDSMRSKLQSSIRNSDGVIVIITENSLRSQFVLTEIGTARTLSETNPNKFFIPVIVGEIEIPPIVQDIFCLKIGVNDLNQAIGNLHTAIVKFEGEREKEEQQVRQFETNVAQYVNDVIKKLDKREKSNKWIGQVWYLLGYASLLAGVCFAIFGFIDIATSGNTNIGVYVLLTLKSLIIIGLLIALSKYAFNLGKSFVNESLKNADRIHAISFGEFYLKAFKDRTDYEQIKEVFQHWNISNESIFSTLSTSDFDPKLLENLVELAKVMSTSKKGK